MKKKIIVIICILVLIFTLTACIENDGRVDIESGVYIAQNILMKRDVPDSPILNDEWYVDDNETEDFLIDKLIITVIEGGKEGEYETFSVNGKIYTLSIEVTAQGEEHTVVYTGAEYGKDKEIRIGFETKDFYIRIFGYARDDNGNKYIEATVGYGRSQRHSVREVKFIKE